MTAEVKANSERKKGAKRVCYGEGLHKCPGRARHLSHETDTQAHTHV